MKSPKKLSIITINLNNKVGLEKTINSIINQSFPDYEFLVIDGESSDGSKDVIIANSTKIHYWISEPDNGIYHAMNKGIYKANGQYLLFLNSGDWLYQDILHEAVDECTGEDIVYFDTYLSYNNIAFEKLKYSPNLTMRSFFKKTIGHQSTLIKRELFFKWGVYNENFRLHSDYNFWIKSIIIENASCKYVNKVLSYYDMSGGSSRPNKSSEVEVNLILSHYLPKRILEDYEYWYKKEKEIEILMWYKGQKNLYKILIFLYKIISKVS